MRVAIVTRSEEIYSSRRLVEEARRQGCRAHVIPVLHSAIRLAESRRELWVGGEPVGPFEGVIPRVGSYLPELALAVVRHLEDHGTIPLNRAQAIQESRHKLRALERLGHAGIPIPRSVSLKDLDQLHWSVEAVGGPPVVVKPVIGSQGRRIVLSESLEGAASVIESLVLLHQDVIVQEFVEEAAGSDLRAFVVGDEIVASVRRIAPPGRFRANWHQGGQLVPIELDPEETEMARNAAQVFGLRVAGVDLLRSRRGPLVLEVNSSPGLEGIEQATGRDLAAPIIADLVRVLCRSPAPE